MRIDALTYELKYKNDPMVLDLLRAYQDNESNLSLYEYTEKELENLLNNIQDDTSVEDIMDSIKDLKERMEF